MMLAVLIAGIGLLVAGLVTIGLGIELDLSLGNTLLLAGAIVACTGVLMLGLWVAVRELKAIARQLSSGLPEPLRAGSPRSPAGLSAALGDQAPEDDGFPFSRDQPAPGYAGSRGTSRPVAGAAMARRGRFTGPRRGPWPRASRGVGRHKTAPQSAVFLLVQKGARARPGADSRTIRNRSASAGSWPCTAGAGSGRTGCGASRDFRRRLAEAGTRPRRRRATATTWRPNAVHLCGCGGRRSTSRRAVGARRGSAGHRAQIRRRRWHGLFAVFRRLDRGADARRHDAVRIHRRAARSSRPASCEPQRWRASSKNKLRRSCHINSNPLISDSSGRFR